MRAEVTSHVLPWKIECGWVFPLRFLPQLVHQVFLLYQPDGRQPALEVCLKPNGQKHLQHWGSQQAASCWALHEPQELDFSVPGILLRLHVSVVLHLIKFVSLAFWADTFAVMDPLTAQGMIAVLSLPVQDRNLQKYPSDLGWRWTIEVCDFLWFALLQFCSTLYPEKGIWKPKYFDLAGSELSALFMLARSAA